MTSHTLTHALYHIPRKQTIKWRAQHLLQAGAIHVMENGSKIVSANVSAESAGELAASPSQNSLPGGNSPVCLREDVPGASLNGHEPSQLHVVELKHWLKCRAAATAGKKQELVKW